MVFIKKEKRTCNRFKIPEATLSYKKSGFFFSSPDYEDEFCPILDLSLAGLRFLTDKNLKVNSNLIMKVSYPENDKSVHLSGKVKWVISNPGFSDKYQVGIKFKPYGDKKGLNRPEDFEQIKSLELKYARKGED